MRAERTKTMQLVRTAKGQLEGVIRMMEDDRYCVDIAMQLQAVESLVHKANREVIKAHLEGCVRAAFTEGDEAERESKLSEILQLLERQ